MGTGGTEGWVACLVGKGGEEISGDLEGLGAIAETTCSVLEETTGCPGKGGPLFEEAGLVPVNPPIDFNGTTRGFDWGGNAASST